MDIIELRRENLRRWVRENGTPAKERSLFSQLQGGVGSFGEKVARRLEEQYKMGRMYLDTWVMHGEIPADPLAETFAESSPFIEDSRPVREGEVPDTIAIRKVTLRLRAGATGFETEPELVDGGYEHVPREVIARLRLDTSKLLALRVAGPSMEPMMFEDDVVIIDTTDNKPTNKELYALNWNGEALVKQLISRGREWYLHSINSDFPDENVRSGQCSVVGKVVYQPGRVLTGRL